MRLPFGAIRLTAKRPKKQKAAYPFPVELIDRLLAHVENKDAESILGENGLAGQLKRMLAERMLSAELSHHLANEGEGGKNRRNGNSPGTDENARRFYNAYQVSADYRLDPQSRIGALAGIIKDTSGGDAGARGANVGALYDLSRRTTLYGFASDLKNETNAAFRSGGSGGVAANLAGAGVNGKALTGLQLGMVHRF